MNRHPILFSLLAVFFVFLFLISAFVVILFLTNFNRSKPLFAFGDIAVVKIDGAIFDSTKIMKELQRYKKKESIKAIVLRIDSPGGAVAPCQEIFEEVKKIKEKKKVIVSMGTLAASGGYYIASAAHHILASPGTITGSIGVIMENMGFQHLLEKVEVENRVIKSGEYKDVGSPFRAITPKERDYLQAILDNMYDRFVKDVSEQRGIAGEKMKELAEGKIYTGEQALKLGLVDGLGNLYDALDQAKKLANLPEDARVIWPSEEGMPWGKIVSSLKGMNSLESYVKKYFDEGNHFPIGLYLLKQQYLP